MCVSMRARGSARVCGCVCGCAHVHGWVQAIAADASVAQEEIRGAVEYHHAEGLVEARLNAMEGARESLRRTWRHNRGATQHGYAYA